MIDKNVLEKNPRIRTRRVAAQQLHSHGHGKRTIFVKADNVEDELEKFLRRS